MRHLPGHEVVGARIGQMPTHDLVAIWTAATSGIVRYGFGMDQWYSDFVHTDWRYVERYYQTDQLPPWNDCVVSGSPLIAPAAIPPLKQRQVEVRFAF